MKTKIILFALCMFLLHQMLYAQSEGTFYYYKGEKIALEIDYGTISFASTSENLNETRAATSLRVKNQTPDYSRTTVIPVTRSVNTLQPSYIGEIELQNTVTPAQYSSILQELRNNPEIIQTIPSFKIRNKKLGVSNNFYVKLSAPESITTLYNLAQQYNIDVLGYNEFMPLWFTLSCTRNTPYNAIEAANLFQESNLFDSAEPEFLYHDLLASNDPLFIHQWGFKHTGQSGWNPRIDIKAEQAWNITTGSVNIKTAVYDHGFEMNHPDMQANTYGTGYDAKTGTTPARVRGSHGTACAGIIGAVQNNQLGVSGISPSCKLMSISIDLVFSDTPQQLANGFNWAWQNGADIISNSWGGYAPSSIIDNAITNTLTNGRQGKGTVIVFASGNEDDQNIRYPGNSNPSILVVGAISPCGERKNPESCDNENWWGSCYGNPLDIMAPGVIIPTTDQQGNSGYNTGDYTLDFNGTSSACPHVAGVASLILSVNPELTSLEVNDIIELTAQKIRTDLYSYQNKAGRTNGTWNLEMGYGLVDAFEAVKLAQSYACIPNINITEPVTSSHIYQAGNSITASSLISENITVDFKANTITLAPGFAFRPGNSGSFSVKIEPCTIPVSTRSAEDTDSNLDYRMFYLEALRNSNNLDSNKADQNVTVMPGVVPGTYTIHITHIADGNLEIFNTQGNRIHLNRFRQASQLEIDLNNQPSGIYIVKISLSDKVFSNKIIL